MRDVSIVTLLLAQSLMSYINCVVNDICDEILIRNDDNRLCYPESFLSPSYFSFFDRSIDLAYFFSETSR